MAPIHTDVCAIKDIDDLNNIVSKNKSTAFIVELYTPWCSKCKRLEENIKTAKLNYKVYKINIDAGPFIDDAQFEKIKSLPCIWIYKNGNRTEINTDNISKINEQVAKVE